jgi:glycosyltransferase involved in cell wall biosynthesis
MSHSLITVIIPVYNCERYLAEAIDSALSQTWRPTEIIVVDDGSTDGSAAIAGRFAPRIKYDLISHGGAGAARNRGVALAAGDYLAFLDADDLWTKRKLESQMAIFNSPNPPDLLLGFVEHFISPDVDSLLANKIRCPTEPMPGRVPGTMLIPTPIFKRVGPFCETLTVGEFVEWYSRAMDLKLKELILSDVVLRRRLHSTNLGILNRDARSDYARVAKAAIDRRRQKIKETGS